MTIQDNSDLRVIEEEIDNVLDVYLGGFYKTAFKLTELHQKLLNYVFRQIIQSDRVIENSQNPHIKQALPYHSLELRLQLETYIQEGIDQILANNPEVLSLILALEQFESEHSAAK